MGSPPQPPAWMEPTAPSLAISLRDLATVTMATQSPATGPSEKGRGPRLGQGCVCEGARERGGTTPLPNRHLDAQVEGQEGREAGMVSVTNTSPEQPRHHNTLRDRKTPGDRGTAGERNSTFCATSRDTPPRNAGISDSPPSAHSDNTGLTACHMGSSRAVRKHW